MAADEGARTELARAKVNLFLHVRKRRADGYHELESLAVFPRIGDILEAEPAVGLSLSLSGPFAAGLPAGADNLALGAALRLSAATQGRPGAALRLVKALPVAAGIGGGSADAGAALRLLRRLWKDAAEAEDIARDLGADAPVCFASRPALMGGAGERLTSAPHFPEFWMVLVNPMRALSTAAVFGALERRDHPAGPPPPARFAGFEDLLGWLAEQRNDLEAPARRLEPVIDRILGATRGTPGCGLARMSGSGATAFGLYAGEAAALAAADALRTAEPGWWVAAAPVEKWTGGRAEADGFS